MNSQLPGKRTDLSFLASNRNADDIVRFFSHLGLEFPPAQIVEIKFPGPSALAGWQPILGLTGFAQNGCRIEIDVRHAWGTEIFRQKLIDIGGDFLTSLKGTDSKHRSFRQMLLYFCEPSTGLQIPVWVEKTPGHFIPSADCTEISHVYVRLPFEHPFRIPSLQPPVLTGGYSTTRSSVRNDDLFSGNTQSPTLFLPHTDGSLSSLHQGGLRIRGYTKKDQAGSPLVSIVTPVLNGVKYIEQAIQSVINQAHENIEYVIVDGGSTDGTIEILKDYEGQLDYWISEADQGIYPAMNKGWSLSQGVFVYYLGADDFLFDLPIRELRKAQGNLTEIVYGDVLLSNGRRFVSRYGPMLRFNNTLHHQGLFLRRSLFQLGPFDEDLKVFSDFDLNQKLKKSKKSALKANRLVAFFRLTRKRDQCDSKEFFRIIRRNFGVPTMALAFAYLRMRGLAFRLQGWRN